MTSQPEPPKNWLRLGSILENTFATLMTTDHAEQVDRYPSDLSSASPEIEAIAIFSRDEEPSFEDNFLQVPAKIVQKALQPGVGFQVE